MSQTPPLRTSVNKSTADFYSIRRGAEWANIVLRDWTRPVNRVEGGEDVAYCGEIFIYSSYGVMAGQWGHAGTPFRRFLTELEFSYFMQKTWQGGLYEFSMEKTCKGVRQTIVDYRRRDGLSKAEARTLFDHVADIEANACGENGFVEMARDIAYEDDPHGYLRNEPWEHLRREPKEEARLFWSDLWPLLMTELKKELP